MGSAMKYILTFLFLILNSISVHAATCFWVGGTGSWSTANTASWSSSSGGGAGTCAATGGIPKQAADTATFDASSGGGTVTVDTTMNGTTLTGIVAGQFGGTLTFATNNPSMTITGSFNISGTGTRTVSLGSGTFSLTGTNTTNWDAGTATNLTLTAGTSTILFTTPGNGNSQNFLGGGRTYATVSIAGRTNGSVVNFGDNSTIGTLTATGPVLMFFGAATTQTITNALALVGTSSAPIMLASDGPVFGSTLAIASGSTATWAVIKNMTFSGNSLTATNSLSLGSVTNATITPPSTGGGGRIIGG